MPYKQDYIPQELKLDISTLHDQIWNTIYQYCDNSNIDYNDYKTRVTLKHNTVFNMLRYLYNNIFKSPVTLLNNQSCVIDFEDIETLSLVAYEFIDICSYFNVAHGVWAFETMLGMDPGTLQGWENPGGSASETSRKRSLIVKNIREYNKNALLGLLKDSGLGALSVANNDVDTGLLWSQNQQQITTQNNVYYIPSERIDKLRIDKNPPE